MDALVKIREILEKTDPYTPFGVVQQKLLNLCQKIDGIPFATPSQTWGPLEEDDT